MESPFNCQPSRLVYILRTDRTGPKRDDSKTLGPRICCLSNKTRRIKLFQIYRDKGVLCGIYPAWPGAGRPGSSWSRCQPNAGTTPEGAKPNKNYWNVVTAHPHPYLYRICVSVSVSVSVRPVYLCIYVFEPQVEVVAMVGAHTVFSHRFVPQNDRPRQLMASPKRKRKKNPNQKNSSLET